MKHILSLLVLLFLLTSCGASRAVSSSVKHSSKSVVKAEGLKDLESRFSGTVSSKRQQLLKAAEKYIGSPYKYGGNSSAGFDCSGLVCKVFDENNYKLPRRSSEQARIGDKIEIRNVKPGDLLFFTTTGGFEVSHVGIVHDIGSGGEVKFIHASTSKGVIISSLNEKYWNKAFLYAREVL